KDELESLKSQLSEQMAEKEDKLSELEEEQDQLEDYKVSLEDEQEILRKQEAANQKAIELAKQEKQKLGHLAKENSNSGKSSGGSGSGVTSSGKFTHPVSNGVTSEYGQRWGKLHAGIDYGSPVGTSVKSAASGVVISTHTEYDGTMNGYGNAILISHSINGESYTTLYAHLSSISVSAGQTVSGGQTIGASGNTGSSTGPHLHFEIHKGGWNASKSNSVNPLNYLN